MMTSDVQHATEKIWSRAAVGVSAERFGGDAGRSLVAVDRPRHDAARISQLQGISGVLRGDCNEHIGRSTAQADRERDYNGCARSVGWAEVDLFADGEGDRPGAGAEGDGAVGGGA